MSRIEQKLVVGIEKKQEKLSDTLREINDLVKDSFSVKGSSYEIHILC